jgi:hypothetical protein
MLEPYLAELLVDGEERCRRGFVVAKGKPAAASQLSERRIGLDRQTVSGHVRRSARDELPCFASDLFGGLVRHRVHEIRRNPRNAGVRGRSERLLRLGGCVDATEEPQALVVECLDADAEASDTHVDESARAIVIEGARVTLQADFNRRTGGAEGRKDARKHAPKLPGLPEGGGPSSEKNAGKPPLHPIARPGGQLRQDGVGVPGVIDRFRRCGVRDEIAVRALR